MSDTDDLTKLLGDQAARLLGARDGPGILRRLIGARPDFDRELWAEAGRLGWIGILAAEADGGSDAGWGALAAVLQAMGRQLASIPYSPTAVGLVTALTTWGSPEQRANWLPRLVSGESIGCVWFPDGGGAGRLVGPSLDGDRLTGRLGTVSAGSFADVMLLQHDDELLLLDMKDVARVDLASIDGSRGLADVIVDSISVERLPGCTPGSPSLLRQRMALAASFEQIGGAEACLEAACDYARERHSFGQQIGRFQAIKHRLSEVYAAIELAKGCAQAALARLVSDTDTAEGRSSSGDAAMARLAASRAYEKAARDLIQTLGAIGVTWEADAHLHYRRARVLAVELGTGPRWRDELIDDWLDGVDRRASREADAPTDFEAQPDEKDFRLRASQWLSQNAPAFAGEARRGLSLEQDIALARRWQALKAADGYTGLTVPVEYGGAGRSEVEKLIFDEEELRYDLPTEYFSISLSMPIPMLLRHASEHQRHRYIPPALRGEEIWCQLFSEPAAGSDLAALRLSARRADGGWRLQGQKLWTSWAQISEFGVIVARTDPAVAKHAGLTYFFVDLRSAGVTIRTITRMSGHRDVNEVFFDDVFVPDDQRLGEVGAGFRLAIETLTIERYAVTDEAGYGPPIEMLLPLVAERGADGRLHVPDAHVRQVLAEALVERAGLQAINRTAVAAIGAGADPGPEGAIRKLLSAATRLRIAELAMDAKGADGLLLDPDQQLRESFVLSWLDGPSLRIAGGTDEMLLNTIAERILGLPQDQRPDKGRPFNAS